MFIFRANSVKAWINKGMNKILSTGTKQLYQSVVARLGNGYVTTKGMNGPTIQTLYHQTRRFGLHAVSQSDQFLRNFSVSNSNIAAVSERWYGRDITQRAILGNASQRHRCVVDMTRNDDGGLLRAVFDKFGQLRKTLSIAKDGSSVSTTYKVVTTPTGIANLSKKVVRDVDGTILRTVYSTTQQTGRKPSYTFVADRKNGLKEIINSHNGFMSIFREGIGFEHISKPDFTLSCVKPNGVKVDKCYPAGMDDALHSSWQTLSELGWIKFLQQKSKS